MLMEALSFGSGFMAKRCVNMVGNRLYKCAITTTMLLFSAMKCSLCCLVFVEYFKGSRCLDYSIECMCTMVVYCNVSHCLRPFRVIPNFQPGQNERLFQMLIYGSYSYMCKLE